MDLEPGEVRAVEGKLIVGCAAGSVLLVMRARVVESAGLPSEWLRAVDNLDGSSVRVGTRKTDRPAFADVAREKGSQE
jgi:hypothetical protein